MDNGRPLRQILGFGAMRPNERALPFWASCDVRLSAIVGETWVCRRCSICDRDMLTVSVNLSLVYSQDHFIPTIVFDIVFIH